MVAGRVLFKSWRPGLAAGALIAVHFVCDALSGHTHHVFGPDSPALALGLYATAPFVALAIEVVFTAGVMGWLVHLDKKAGVRRHRHTYLVWILVLGSGIASLLPVASQSAVELFGIEPIAALDGTLVPGLVAIYVANLIALIWAEGRPVQNIAPVA